MFLLGYAAKWARACAPPYTSYPQARAQLQGRLLLDVVVGDRVVPLQLLAGEEEAALAVRYASTLSNADL
jgi:hypothetical protein